MNQDFVWEVEDTAGATLDIRVNWTEVDESAVALLESFKDYRDNPIGVVGRVELSGNKIFVYPFSILSSGTIQGDHVLCPQFDQSRLRSRNESLLQRLRKKFYRDERVKTQIGSAVDEDDLFGLADDSLFGGTLPALVADAERVVGVALESGAQRYLPNAATTLSTVCEQLSNLGATSLSEALALSLEDTKPVTLLRASYRLQVFRQSMRLSQLTLAE
ncbi:MAG: hypothetical protein CMJ78_23730 [Planctomycetaceae bacterium]|nr:hypothetical protein [Planctomycetaceae bacterium]